MASLLDSTSRLLPDAVTDLPQSMIDSPITPYANENTRFGLPETRGIREFWRKNRKPRQDSLQRYLNWEAQGREPYHEYVHQLVDAGWDNLKGLDDYMSEDWEDRDLVISVLDITDKCEQKRHSDIRNEVALKTFLSDESRDGVKVRLYMAEQRGHLSSAVIEAFGSVLGLDPRFFQWNLFGNRRILSPAERHRAPFTSIGFTIPKDSNLGRSDLEYFRVSIYIQPAEAKGSWTSQSSIVA